MLKRQLSVFTTVCLALDVFIATGLLTPPGWSTDTSPEGSFTQRKRQPATIQQQGNINSVSAPGQQTQNATSTAGEGNGTDPDPGVITNPAATPMTNVVNCTDVTTGRDNKCWEELKLTRWVEDWVDTNACYAGEAFATCFLRKEGFPGLDCTGIKIDACTAPQGDNVLKQPEVFYVAYNIYGVNQFFLSWWTAVGDAASMASDNVGEIVQLLDPLDTTNTLLDDVLITLTGVFALVPGAGYLVSKFEGGLTEGWTTFAQVFENALFTVPQIGRWIFPIDSVTSQVIQMADLSTQMGSIIQTVQNNLNKTLVDVMDNTTMFLSFASQGNFSASAPSLPDQTNYLLYAFNTYLISQALNGNGIYGVIGLNSNPQSLSFNGTKTNSAFDFSKCQGYNEQNVCDAWWFSGRYNSAFALDDFNHMGRNFGDVLTTLFSNYTTGELLFDGAYACNANGNYGQPVNVTVNSAGVNTGCLSQLRIVTWDMSCDNPLQHTAIGCEFLERPRQGQFFGDCNSHSAYSVMDDPVYCVPYGYLGPLVTQDGMKLKRT